MKTLTRAGNLCILACSAIAAMACYDLRTVDEPSDADPDEDALVASEPINVTAVPGSKVMTHAAAVSYISLAPGTVRGGISARIRNISGGGQLSAPITVFGGGFDPIAVSASTDDEFEIAVTDADGVVTLLKATVPKRRPPTIVRTSPPKGRTDVAVKVVPTIVFSEPIDAQSVTGEVRLTSGGSSISAQVSVNPAAPWLVDVVPSTPLQPMQTYQITIRTGVRDLDGDGFEKQESVSFTTGPDFAFGGRVAFVSTRDGSPAIYTADGDGSRVTRLTSGDKPSWSPDGSRIAYNLGGALTGPFSADAEIHVINVDGTGDTRLASGADAAWSPDGTRIAFADSIGIAVINVDGSGFKRLIRHDAALRGSPGHYSGAPAWSPDSRYIAFEHGNEDFPQHIFVMNADGEAPSQLTPTLPNGEFAECNPQWSPGGTSLLLWNFDVGVATMDAGSPGLRRLFWAPLSRLSCFSSPAWTSDATAATFTYFTEDGRNQDWRGRIYVVSRVGGTPHQLIPDVIAPANPSYTDRDATWSRR